MIIGTLPVVIAISSNLRDARRDGRMPWRRLAPALLLIAAGIGLVNHDELARLRETAQAAGGTLDVARHAIGALLAIAAVACWTWYPIRNADWLREGAPGPPKTGPAVTGLAVTGPPEAGPAALGRPTPDRALASAVQPRAGADRNRGLAFHLLEVPRMRWPGHQIRWDVVNPTPGRIDDDHARLGSRRAVHRRGRVG